MTTDDILRMARAADLTIQDYSGEEVSRWREDKDLTPYLERFAALVAAAEREECAKVCEAISDEYHRREGFKYPEMKTDAETGASDCEAAIRARGKT